MLQCNVMLTCTLRETFMFPASRGKRPLNLVTFCLGSFRGIRRTGWTLVSDDITVFKHLLYRFDFNLLRSVLMSPILSVSPTHHPADMFFSHPFLEPSSTIKKCKHKNHNIPIVFLLCSLKIGLMVCVFASACPVPVPSASNTVGDSSCGSSPCIRYNSPPVSLGIMPTLNMYNINHDSVCCVAIVAAIYGWACWFINHTYLYEHC